MRSHLFCALLFGIVFLSLFIIVPLSLVYTHLARLGELDRMQASEDSDDVVHLCPSLRFPCTKSLSDEKKVICIERRFQCDGNLDCPQGEDERNCVDLSPNVQDHHQRLALSHGNASIFNRSNMKYHMNCTFDDLVDGSCPCHLSHNETIICKNQNLTSVPSGLLDTIMILNLEFNEIRSIDSAVINVYRNLRVLSLRGNRLTHLEAKAFLNLSKLKRLYLAENSLSSIDSQAFEGLEGLVKVYIGWNKLHHLNMDTFLPLSNLNFLDLSNNLLSLDDQDFPLLPKLRWLDLGNNNKIRNVRSTLLMRLPGLTTLTLRDNGLHSIEFEAFSANTNLTELDLGYNDLRTLHASSFRSLDKLKKLDLNNNPMTELPLNLFRDLYNLNSLNLSEVLINNIDLRHFSFNRKLTHIYFKKFRYCMFAPRVRVCRPHNDGLSSTQNLLFHQILKTAVWIVALVTCSGNVVVFVWRSLSTKEDEILSLFVQNLSAADFFMGIYLLTIGMYDLAYEGEYNQFALDWMASWQCSFIGFLAMLSSELSVLIVTLITVERYRCITANFRIVTPSSAKINLVTAWILATLMAAYPLMHWSRTGQNVFYGSSSLCFPLHIDDPFMNGWEYSAVIFLGVNLPAVVLIIYLYIRMFVTIKSDRKFSRPVCLEKKREDAVLAVRFFFIVFTDCVCWLPIVFVKILAFLDISINPALNAWLVVFVLPVNSALNPIIYTLAAPTELHRRIYKNLSKVLKAAKCPFLFAPRSVKAKPNEQFTSSLTGSDATRNTRISSNGSVTISMATLNGAPPGAPTPLIYHSSHTS